MIPIDLGEGVSCGDVIDGQAALAFVSGSVEIPAEPLALPYRDVTLGTGRAASV